MAYKGFRVQEMQWLEDHQDQLKQMPMGYWLAVDGSQLIAVARTLDELIFLCHQVGHPDCLITAIPLNIHESFMVGELLHA